MWLLGLFFTFLGIFTGGMIAWFFKGLHQKADIFYGLCAGIILGLISFEIFPEAIELGGWLSTFTGLTIGMAIFGILHNSLHNNRGEKRTAKKNLHIHTGLLLVFSFAIHNIPMGIILGANQESDFTMTLLQTLLFHSIPEGIILFTPMILAGAGMTIFMIFLIAFTVSIPVALGVLIGDLLGFVHPSINTIMISFTLGIIFMVTVSEILYPALMKSSATKVIFWVLMGFGIIGIYLMLV